MWESPGWLENVGGEASEEAMMGPEISGRILIIDDDPHFLRVWSRILSGANFQVDTASGVNEALRILRDQPIDLVISDMRMPDTDGLSFVQEIRRVGNNLPVVILTAYGEVDTYLQAMNLGATEFLNKPIKSDELLRVVRTCLRASSFRSSAGPGPS
ncbi:MAG TPA: response regulator [Terriglobia bacterium]|jgi:DNA-binding NtrC family response regulator|nr:response regulator [Terriglobia bacterium]